MYFSQPPYKNYTFINKVLICYKLYIRLTVQKDFVRIVTIMILPHFISNWKILMFLKSVLIWDLLIQIVLPTAAIDILT
jgi:hypothetical protein